MLVNATESLEGVAIDTGAETPTAAIADGVGVEGYMASGRQERKR